MVKALKGDCQGYEGRGRGKGGGRGGGGVKGQEERKVSKGQ